MPTVGDSLSMEDMEMIFEAVRDRQKNFPDEPASLSMWLVFQGIGERFRQIVCIEQEWTGLKKDVLYVGDEPRCPNGHSLTAEAGMTIGWVATE